MIKKRLQRGKAKTIQDGGYCANAPYGYKRVYIEKKPSLQVVEEEAKFVRMMFDCYGNREMGGNQIAEYISSLGARSHRGNPFARTSVLKILRNPVYIGKITWNRDSLIRKGQRGNDKNIVIHHPKEEWTMVEGLHPPIVSQELFEKVQTRLGIRSHEPYFTGVVENPLAGLVLCAHCGSHMQRQGCRGGPLLICSKRGCNVSSRLDYVEEALILQLEQEAARLKAELRSGQKKDCNADSVNLELPLLETELKKTRNQLERLHDLVEQGVYDIATFITRRDELQSRIKQMEKKKELLLLHSGRTDQTEQIYENICHALDLYPSATPQERNELLKSVVERVSYHKERGALPKEFQLEIVLRPQD